jgi:hypothetical protein
VVTGSHLGSLGRRLPKAVAAAVASAVPVAAAAVAVRQKFQPILMADKRAIQVSTAFSRTHELTPALLTLQRATRPVVLYSACTLGVVWVGVTKRLRGRASWAFVTMMTGWSIGGVAKLLVRRVRPVVDDPLSHSRGSSFPSGHALNVAAAGSTMIILVWPLLGRTGRWLSVVQVAGAGLLVGLDRVLLGVHFPSDVIAGWLLGLGVTVTSWIVFSGMTATPVSGAPLQHPAQP